MRELVRVFESLPESYCRHLVEKFEVSRSQQIDGKAGNSGWNKKDPMTGWQEINLSDHTASWADEIATFEAVIERIVPAYEELVGARLPERYRLAPFRIKKYVAARGHRFAPHVDASSSRDGHRFLAILFYLSSVAEGGETEFPGFALHVPPVAGRVLVFPPFWMFPHGGRTPLSHDKYVLGTYLVYA